MYLEYINEATKKNMSHVEHFRQICQHEDQLLANSKNPQNLEELTLYKQTVIVQIDWTFPPFFTPRHSEVKHIKNMMAKASSTQQLDLDTDKLEAMLGQDKIIEPFSEHEDYLGKDDFGKIISDLKSYAGRQGNRLKEFGENILNQYLFKKQESTVSVKDHESD